MNRYYLAIEKSIESAAITASFSDRYMLWLEELEDIIDDIQTAVASGGSLNITSIETISSPGVDADATSDRHEIWLGEFSLQVSA